MEFGRGDDLPIHEPQLQEKVPQHKALSDCESSRDGARQGRPYFWKPKKRCSEELLPSWSANPQSAEEEQIPLKSTLVFTAKKRKNKFSLAVAAFCVVGFTLYWNSRTTLKAALIEVSNLVAVSQRLHLQLRSAEKDVRVLERELAALDMMEQQKEDLEVEESVRRKASAFVNPKVVEEMNALQKKLKWSAERAEELKEQVRALSKRDAVAKYGDGLKRVEIELIFPEGTEGPDTFVIEMAPLDIMPHSVFTFLEMVSSGLLDGCSFILNALHVLKAAPLPYDGTSASDKARAFTRSGLESVAFREYTPAYPHKRYTVGFAADGSPSFYINTEDNTEIHFGDPCFAKIVSGFDTIKRLEASPTRNGIWFEHRIGIRRATIL